YDGGRIRSADAHQEEHDEGHPEQHRDEQEQSLDNVLDHFFYLSFFDTVVLAEQSISEPFIPISAQNRTDPPEPTEPPFSRFPQTSVSEYRSALTHRQVRPPALVFVGLA